MGWRSNRTSAAPAGGPAPAALAAQLKSYGVTTSFLAFLRERGHTIEQIVLFFESGGQLQDLEVMVGYRTAAPPAQRPQLAAEPEARPQSQAAAPAAAESAEPRREPARRTRARGTHSRDEVIAHGGLTILFGLVVVANGLGTVFGVISLMPIGLGWLIAGVVIGLALHVLISRIEIAYLSWRYLFTWFALPLLAAMLLDVGTSIQGLLWIARSVAPRVFADGMPSNVWEWGELVGSSMVRLVMWGRTLAGEQVDWASAQLPRWSAKAWAIILLMSAVALGSERLLRWSYRRFREIQS